MNPAAWRAWLAALALALPVMAGAQTLLDFSATERAPILAHGPWPTAVRPDPGNRADGRPAAVAFGRLLFFDLGLSVDGRRSCASCQVPALAFQDGQATAQSRAQG